MTNIWRPPVSEETERWIRRRPDRKENLLAFGAGLGMALVVGGAAFYVARLLAAREPLSAALGRDGFARGRPGER
jgi:hypothetical protein